jgi:hypothetical protein
MQFTGYVEHDLQGSITIIFHSPIQAGNSSNTVIFQF